MPPANRKPSASPRRKAEAPAAAARPKLRRGRLRPEHGALAAILALSSVLEFNKLSQNGYALTYYSASVRSMLDSLHNFFFLAADPRGLISVDKPPLGLWLEVLSAKLFGFAPLSLLMPEAIIGVLSVALVYVIVAPRLGAVAGLLSALGLAVFPSFVAVTRDNGVDPLLIALMLAACWAGLVAIESGRTRSVLLTAVLVGLAFETKSLAALLCVPGIGLGYLFCGPGTLRRKAAQLAAGAVVLAVVALAWPAAVDLTPAGARPYVGSSSNNSELGLALGYNGFGRVGGETGGPGRVPAEKNSVLFPLIRNPVVVEPLPGTKPTSAAGAKRASHGSGTRQSAGRRRLALPLAFGGEPRPWRVFGSAFGDQDGWTIPLALVGMIALVLALLGGRAAAAAESERGWRRDARSAMLFVLGGWFLVELLTIDFSEGIVHPYYASALAPGVAVMAGAGAVAICGLLARGRSGGGAAERDGRRGMALLVLAVVASVGVQILLIHREGYPEYWRIPLVVLALAGLAVVVLVRGRAALAVYALVLVLMVAPALYSSSVWDAPVEGTFPVAGPYNYAGPGGFGVGRVGLEINRSLWRYLRSHQPGKRFALLTVASDTASPLILFGLDAASLGGYNGSDPAMSADTLAKLVASDEARYVMIGGPFAIRGGNSASTAARLACPEVPSRLWNTDWKTLTPFYLVDCRGRAAELRNPGRTAGAYIAAEIRSGVDIDH